MSLTISKDEYKISMHPLSCHANFAISHHKTLTSTPQCKVCSRSIMSCYMLHFAHFHQKTLLQICKSKLLVSDCGVVECGLRADPRTMVYLSVGEQRARTRKRGQMAVKAALLMTPPGPTTKSRNCCPSSTRVASAAAGVPLLLLLAAAAGFDAAYMAPTTRYDKWFVFEKTREVYMGPTCHIT